MTERNKHGKPGDIAQFPHNSDLFWFERIDVVKARETLQLFLELTLDLATRHSSSGASTKLKPVRIILVAGEATHDEYSHANKWFEKLLALPNVIMEMAAGPVLSGTQDGKSVIWELVLKYPKKFKFYHFPMRVDDHWKIVLVDSKPELLQLECPHGPAPVEDCFKATLSRKNYFFTEQPEHVTDFDRRKHPFQSVFKVETRIAKKKISATPVGVEEQSALAAGFDNENRNNMNLFEWYRKRLGPYNPNADKRIPVLRIEDIRLASKMVRKRGGLYDFSTADDIIDSLKEEQECTVK